MRDSPCRNATSRTKAKPDETYPRNTSSSRSTGQSHEDSGTAARVTILHQAGVASVRSGTATMRCRIFSLLVFAAVPSTEWSFTCLLSTLIWCFTSDDRRQCCLCFFLASPSSACRLHFRFSLGNFVRSCTRDSVGTNAPCRYGRRSLWICSAIVRTPT